MHVRVRLTSYTYCVHGRGQDRGQEVFGVRWVPTEAGCALGDTNRCGNTSRGTSPPHAVAAQANATARDQPSPRGPSTSRRGATGMGNNPACHGGSEVRSSVYEALERTPAAGMNAVLVLASMLGKWLELSLWK